MVKISDLDIAAQWLRAYDPDSDGYEACKAVADMLDRMAETRERAALDRATRAIRGDITLGDILARVKDKMERIAP